MSIYQCNACGRLTEAANVERHGSRCGVRLSGSTWCQGTYIEHGCGGPKEACGADGCQECGGSRATGDIDLHARVARLTAEVERLKGRERQSRALLYYGITRDNIARTEDTKGLFDPNRPEQNALNWVDARAAWLAGCKP